MHKDVHPNWQSEHDEPVPVHVKEESATPEEGMTEASVSRRPAAMVGMFLVIAAGFTLFDGMDALRGQVTTGATVAAVQITENGLEPARLEVEHGQTITWTNTQDVPHILESDTLCSDTGFCLQTSTLFNGDSDTFSITVDMKPGTYEYFSSIADDMKGEIVIVTEVADDFQDFTDFEDVLQDSVANDFPPVNTTTPPPAVQNNSFPPPPPAQNNNAAIPSNPYTVGSERIHPFDSGGEPIPEAFGDDPNEAQRNAVASQVFQENRGPIRQPETGAGVWIVILGSVGLLWMMTRNLFAQV